MKTKILLGLIAVFLLGSVGCKKKEGNSQTQTQTPTPTPAPSVVVEAGYDKEDYEALVKFFGESDASGGETNEEILKKKNKLFDITKASTWSWHAPGIKGFEFSEKTIGGAKVKILHYIDIKDMGLSGNLDLSEAAGLVASSGGFKTDFRGNKLTSITLNADSKFCTSTDLTTPGLINMEKKFLGEAANKTIFDAAGSKLAKLNSGLSNGESYVIQKPSGHIFDRSWNDKTQAVITGPTVTIVKK